MTRKIQQQFLEKQIELGRMGPEVLDDEKVTSLEASEDLSDPLFFWQIYSLTGRAPVKAVAEAFYDRVFEDEEEWFREVFAKLSAKSYHITAQMMMYVDCFGGGRLYWGGEDRADMHHGETAARAIMTQKAAERWNVHMNGALEQETPALDAIDPRIRVALNTFLSFFFDKYASKFEFDASCVDFGETYPPRK